MGKEAKQHISFIDLSTSSLREILITTEMVDYVRCKYKVVTLPFKMSVIYRNTQRRVDLQSSSLWNIVYFGSVTKYVSGPLSCVIGALRIGLSLCKKSQFHLFSSTKTMFEA